MSLEEVTSRQIGWSSASAESSLTSPLSVSSRQASIAASARSLDYQPQIMVGDPAACLCEHAADVSPDLVVIGAKRPAGAQGLRSRLSIERVLKQLQAPVLMVPNR